MRILYLNPIGKIGGAERVLLTALSTLPHARLGLVTLSDGPLLDQARSLSVTCESIPTSRGVNQFGDSRMGGWSGKLKFLSNAISATAAIPPLIAKLRATITRFQPDVVHSNGIKTHLLSRWCVPKSTPVVWHIHDFFSHRPTAGRLLHRCSGRVREAIAISQAVATDTAQVLPSVPITCIPNAIDVERFSPGLGHPDDLDRQANLPPTTAIRVGLVATYAHWKGHLTFLDAATKLRAECPQLPLRWYIVGGPIYLTNGQHTEAELRDAIGSRGLQDCVGLVPFAADTSTVYRSLDIVVHASTRPEPFGLTIAEAMACGRAVIVSRAGGAAELFTHERDALGFEPGNVSQLADHVRRLAGDSHLLDRLATSARRTAIEKFNTHQYGERLWEVYQRVVTSSRKSSSQP